MSRYVPRNLRPCLTIVLLAAAGCSGDYPVGPVHGVKTDHPDQATLTSFVDGRLNAGCEADVCAHLEQCNRCEQVVAGLSEEDIERKQRP